MNSEGGLTLVVSYRIPNVGREAYKIVEGVFSAKLLVREDGVFGTGGTKVGIVVLIGIFKQGAYVFTRLIGGMVDA